MIHLYFRYYIPLPSPATGLNCREGERGIERERERERRRERVREGEKERGKGGEMTMEKVRERRVKYGER